MESFSITYKFVTDAFVDLFSEHHHICFTVISIRDIHPGLSSKLELGGESEHIDPFNRLQRIILFTFGLQLWIENEKVDILTIG